MPRTVDGKSRPPEDSEAGKRHAVPWHESDWWPPQLARGTRFLYGAVCCAEGMTEAWKAQARRRLVCKREAAQRLRVPEYADLREELEHLCEVGIGILDGTGQAILDGAPARRNEMQSAVERMAARIAGKEA